MIHKGFTLIELMVTVVILLVLSGTSIAAYLKFSKSQSIEVDAKQIVTELNRVRSLASNLVYPTGCSSLTSYNIRSSDVNGVLSGVVVTAKCVSGDVTYPAEKILGSSHFSSAFDISFAPSTGYQTSGSDIELTVIDNNDPSITKKIVVGVYGSSYLSFFVGYYAIKFYLV